LALHFTQFSSELVQLKLNIEASDTIVSSGDYRRSRYSQRNTLRHRIRYRRRSMPLTSTFVP